MKKITILIFILLYSQNSYSALCTGRFVNPIADICWDCIFPISIGAISTPPPNSLRPDTLNFPSPICICPNVRAGGVPTPGIAFGYWEPKRMVDVTKRPFCMVSVGGITVNPDMKTGVGTAPSEDEDEGRIGTWHLHWYANPIISILNIFTDEACADPASFDLAYMTELDPTWNNDGLTFFLNPESVLFGNIIAQTACMADCIASTVYNPLDPLFWCSGCQGSMYPMNGNVAEHYGSIQSGSLAVQRFTYKLHRQMMLNITSGPEAICFPIPAPIIKKSQYRIQTTIPIPGIGPYGCTPYGRSTILHESFKEIQIAGEDFGYFVWQKRNCCVQ